MTRFEFLTQEKKDVLLPKLYDIMFDNMGLLNGKKDDWCSVISEALTKEPRKLLLIYKEERLAGFFMYYVNQNRFMMEEIQFVKEVQGSGVFRRLYEFLSDIVPSDTKDVEAYARKTNMKSQGILGHLGLSPISDDGTLLRYKGSCQTLFEHYRRKSIMRIAIYGYGNLGRGIEAAVRQNPDMELVALFTRRDPSAIKTNTEGLKVYSSKDVLLHKDEIDVLIICGGSATDLPVMTPMLAEHFNVVDSFDTHADIPKHFDNVNKAAEASGHIALISAGWDPGLFSLNRLYAASILPDGASYTFWGKGVSQGHSDAIRRIEGVLDARQYTVPVDEALSAVRSGSNPTLTTRQMHTRDCYVVAEEGADLARIENEIKTMPKYFADYDTTVHFISMEELKEKHMGIPHGGFVIRSGKTGLNKQNNAVIEYSLKLDSNPEFTSSAILAFARGIYKMHARGAVGCKTVFDIAPADLSPLSPEEIRAHML